MFSPRFAAVLLSLVLSLAYAGCVHTDSSLDYDLVAFTNGINSLIRAGMPYKEAHKAIRERFPRPTAASEAAPLIATRGVPLHNRRFTMMWETTTPGTSLVLTIECDRDMNVARWSIGPLTETR